MLYGNGHSPITTRMISSDLRSSSSTCCPCRQADMTNHMFQLALLWRCDMHTHTHRTRCPTRTLQGRWQEAAALCNLPQDGPALEVQTFHILALMKLKVYQEASIQLQAISEAVERWPFALQWLAAELPAALVRPAEALTSLYVLLERCKTQESSSGSQNTADVWTRRRRLCIFALVGKHTAAAQPKLALALLDALLQDNPGDAQAWSQAARVQALLGDLQAAKGSIARGRAAVATAGGATAATVAREQLGELDQDTAFLTLLSGNPAEAADGYRRCAPVDRQAASNAAVCLAAGGDLVGARRALEAAFHESPLEMLSEPVVANTASLYEACAPTSEAAAAAKRGMAAWVAAAAGDDFDLACCKVGSSRGAG